MKMLIIKSMDFLVFAVSVLAVIIGVMAKNPIALVVCVLFAVVWSSLWCVLSSIACDLRAIKENQQ